ncbi:leucine-rich repeat domain-containing protein [Fulvivirga sediminis]|uniref:Leucine-rich repeat domain-containing protein n=1 Tax=Fulvivirga sediminis TaxID=2803949 RepID=A0A937FAP1_9BACT|nr:hypothetical protein [Fulvivirga sediminis]MBL3658426.1 hypothetical protein [Fulvivirga sediminis]
MGIFSKKEKWRNFSGNINIYSDLKKTDIPKIIAEENIHSLQLYEFKNPSKQTWETLNDFFKKYPDIGLRVLWYDQQDLSFYKEIPNIRNFTIASFNTKDYSPLLSNTELKHFGIEETKSSAVDLSFIREFSDLESLYVDGMKKGLENTKYLQKLIKLTYRGVKLDNLDFLSDLENLEQLRLLFGSYKNLDSISNLSNLKSIELSRVRQIPNFDFLNSLESLEEIEFEGMSKMEIIPELSNLTKLKKVQIHNNLRLKDISNVGRIENLKALIISFAENSKAADRRSIVDQTVKILLNSKSIKYSNVMHWTDDETTAQLTSNGIEQWKWNIKL